MTESTGATTELAAAAARWQAALGAQAALFAPLRDGARMGYVAQPGFAPAGRRRAGLDAAAARHVGAPMLAFVAAGGRVTVGIERFAGFEAAGLDVVFVADDEAQGELAASDAASLLRALKRLIRRGNVLFFVLRPRHELQDAGYEDFLEALGIPFLGACR